MRLRDRPSPSQEPGFPSLGAPLGDFQLRGLEKGARVGSLPLDVAAGFTEGCPRRGTDRGWPWRHRHPGMLPPRSEGTRGPASTCARPGPQIQGCLPEPGEKIKRINQSQTPRLTASRRPSAAGWDSAAPPPAARRRGTDRTVPGPAWGLMWISVGGSSRCNACPPCERSHKNGFGERLRSSAPGERN